MKKAKPLDDPIGFLANLRQKAAELDKEYADLERKADEANIARNKAIDDREPDVNEKRLAAGKARKAAYSASTSQEAIKAKLESLEDANAMPAGEERDEALRKIQTGFRHWEWERKKRLAAQAAAEQSTNNPLDTTPTSQQSTSARLTETANLTTESRRGNRKKAPVTSADVNETTQAFESTSLTSTHLRTYDAFSDPFGAPSGSRAAPQLPPQDLPQSRDKRSPGRSTPTDTQQPNKVAKQTEDKTETEEHRPTNVWTSKRDGKQPWRSWETERSGN